MEEVRREAAGEIIARPHIASVLVKKGYVQSIRQAFDEYLSVGRPAYFKKDKLAPKEGIKAILDAGGVPILAHPIYLYLDYKGLDNLLFDLKNAGLMGIEALYVDNSEEDTESLLAFAEKYDFCVTGGSDFHGGFKKGIEIGRGYGNLSVPYELLERLRLKEKTLKQR